MKILISLCALAVVWCAADTMNPPESCDYFAEYMSIKAPKKSGASFNCDYLSDDYGEEIHEADEANGLTKISCDYGKKKGDAVDCDYHADLVTEKTKDEL